MNVYATWTLDENLQYRGIVVSSKTFDTTMRTPDTYRTSEDATRGAGAMIDALEAVA